MKLLNAKQIKELDACTIHEENIASHELMERASIAASQWIQMHFFSTPLFHIFCGVGNNGGDGLCIARHLHLKGYQTNISIVGDCEKGSQDFTLNLNRLKKWSIPFQIITEDIILNIEENTIIIDAIFGSGLNRKIESFQASIIEKINQFKSIKISIDTPSGFFISQPTFEHCIHANYTLSFQLPKLGFFFPENQKYVGQFFLLDIQLSKKFLQQISCNQFYTTKYQLCLSIKQRNTFDHKGIFGHTILIGGDEKMQGAITLASKSCLVTGCGLVTTCSFAKPECISELMWVPLQQIHKIDLTKYQTIGVGPGLDNHEISKKVLLYLFQNFRSPIVIDAGALNILSEQKDLLSLLPENSILTPHPKEFERLFGESNNSFEQLELQKEMSKKYSCIIILKRAFSVVTFPNGEIHFNSSGNPGLATAGSGDVLTGIITSLLAQKYDTKMAVLLGTFLHGLCGDLAVQKKYFQPILASEIIDQIPHAYSILKDLK